MSGKIKLEVVGVFGTIPIKNYLHYGCDDNGFLTITTGDDGTPLEHGYLFKEWYYIRVMEK